MTGKCGVGWRTRDVCAPRGNTIPDGGRSTRKKVPRVGVEKGVFTIDIKL